MSKYYRTVYRVEVLSKGYRVADDTSLAELERLITTGDCSGVVAVESLDELTPKEAAEALIAQGSATEFFGLTE